MFQCLVLVSLGQCFDSGVSNAEVEDDQNTREYSRADVKEQTIDSTIRMKMEE